MSRWKKLQASCMLLGCSCKDCSLTAQSNLECDLQLVSTCQLTPCRPVGCHEVDSLLCTRTVEAFPGVQGCLCRVGYLISPAAHLVCTGISRQYECLILELDESQETGFQYIGTRCVAIPPLVQIGRCTGDLSASAQNGQAGHAAAASASSEEEEASEEGFSSDDEDEEDVDEEEVGSSSGEEDGEDGTAAEDAIASTPGVLVA